MAKRIFRNYRRKTKAIAALAALVALALAGFVLLGCRVAAPNGSLRQKLTDLLQICVVADSYKGSNCTPDDCRRSLQSVVYILGGTQDSLVLKFRTAIGLCGSGTAKKIMLLSTPAITEYDEILGRNLTNDEWALKELSGLGIACSHIEFIRAEDGFFGTLSEAKAVRKAVLSEGICQFNAYLLRISQPARASHLFEYFERHRGQHAEFRPWMRRSALSGF